MGCPRAARRSATVLAQLAHRSLMLSGHRPASAIDAGT
ncbi:hypothetical protein HMPREF1318_1407 [Actinomyces massiliensis F0489]|uniref:Uncharacterized protein n=1 Tax=Actinomyces massiliensis F0489 TaxID=1125718 RepID=J0MY48_9ACTO|nr:hypothetical protein HMPREF1318_1407 [Actinomyces massiliensis F0489]